MGESRVGGEEWRKRIKRISVEEWHGMEIRGAFG